MVPEVHDLAPCTCLIASMPCQERPRIQRTSTLACITAMGQLHKMLLQQSRLPCAMLVAFIDILRESGY